MLTTPSPLEVGGNGYFLFVVSLPSQDAVTKALDGLGTHVPFQF